MSDEKTFNRWFVVAGALIIQLCLGSIYAYGAFAKPLKADLGSTDLTNQLPFAFGLFFFAIVMVFAGRWQDKVGPKKVAFTGGIVLGLGLMLSSLANSIDVLYITYGVIGGTGIGLAYVCPIAALVKWFPDKKGLISGVAVAGFGAGALIFASVATLVMTSDLDSDMTDFLKDSVDDISAEDQPFLVDGEKAELTGLEAHILVLDYEAGFKDKPLEFDGNAVDLNELKKNTSLEDAKDLDNKELELLVHADPANLSDDDKEKREVAFEDAQESILTTGKNHIYREFNWKGAFFVLGIIFLGGVVVGSQLLVNPPEGWLPEGWTPPVQKTATGEEAKVDYAWEEMLRTPTFWLIWTMFLLAATSGLMTIGNIGKFAADDKSIGVAAIAGIIGILSLANGAGRVVWGATSDKIGRTKSLFFMYIIQGITMFMLFYLGDSVATLAIGAALVGFCFGGNFAMFPSATADYFGTKSVGQNYGFVFTAYGVAGIFGAIIAGKMVEATGSYQTTFTIMGVLSLVAAFLSLICKAPHEKMGIGGILKSVSSE